MMKKRLFAALCAACLLAASSALAELKIECTEVETGLDRLVVFAASAVLPEGAEQAGPSAEANAANTLIAERLCLSDGVRVYTQGGTRGNHERETTISQKGLLWQNGETASIALAWDGVQPDGARGSATLTVALELETGKELTFEELFADADAAASAMEEIIEREVLPELSDYMEYAELLPMPRDRFYFDETGFTVCYPADRYSYFDGKSGSVHFAWHELAGWIGEESPLAGLSKREAEDASAIASLVSEGRFGDWTACGIGDPLGHALEKYTLLADPDYTRGSMVYLFEEAALRGYALEIPKYAETEEEETPICALRRGRISWHGLTTGETTRGKILALLGEPQQTREYAQGAAEDWLLESGESLYYAFGENVLEAHLNENGVLAMLMIRDAMPD